MAGINLFGKTLPYKDYDCSFNRNCFSKRRPIFNLYMQISDLCNANCSFCNKPNCLKTDETFNKDKFKTVLEELYEKNIVGRIAITGGEPLLDIHKLNSVLDAIYSVNDNAIVSINTNGSNLEGLNKVQNIDKIKSLHISRHHQSDKLNNEVFRINVPTLTQIKEFAQRNKNLKIKLNCVLQKGLIDSSNKVEEFLNEVGKDNIIQEVRFVSLLPLTDTFDEQNVDAKPIIEGLLDNTNAGLLYDKDICECLSLIYVSSSGNPIVVLVRNNKKASCGYIRQLVYTPQNNLLTGFSGEIIF